MKRPSRRLRVLVIEDEWPARNYLVSLLEQTGLAEVVGALAGAEDARALLGAGSEMPVDAVFVDVQLVPDGDTAGLDLARELARGPRPPMLVLATAFKEHAIEAYDLGVVDYLLKPFSEERVEACLSRLLDRLPGPEPSPLPPRIVARRGRSLVFLDPAEVWAFEAADRHTCVHTHEGAFDVDLSLSAIESSLGRSFARVHRNWLVNAPHIKKLDRGANETTLFVGRRVAGEGRSGEGVVVPVARERAAGIREMLLSQAMGVRSAHGSPNR